KPVDEKHHIPGRLVLRFGGDFYIFLAERFDEIRIVRRKSAETLAVAVFSLNVMALDRDFLDLPAVDRGGELAEDDLGLASLLLAEDVEQEQKNQHQHQPQGQIFRHLIQTKPPLKENPNKGNTRV